MFFHPTRCVTGWKEAASANLGCENAMSLLSFGEAHARRADLQTAMSLRSGGAILCAATPFHGLCLELWELWELAGIGPSYWHTERASRLCFTNDIIRSDAREKRPDKHKVKICCILVERHGLVTR